MSPLLSASGVIAYFHFVREHRRLLAFGLLAATLSGFGQTFYIGLFNPHLREAFTLSHGELGLLYGGATLASASLLTWLGRLYDRTSLRLFLVLAGVILSLGCLLLVGARSLFGLLAALFLLRLGGQGLMGHIALTTMARRFHGGRGKAVGVAAMGFPVAEALFPFAAVMLLTAVEWRAVWAINAGIVLVLFLPILSWLLAGARGGEVPAEGHRRIGPDWTLRQVVGDRRFALLVPSTFIAPFVVTIAFFHQMPMAQDKGWSTELVASGLTLFAFGHVVGLFGGGPLVDRYSARCLFVPTLLPLAASMAVLALPDAAWAALLWPGLLGLGLGLSATTTSSLLPELYGITHLGAIRALLQAFAIASTAVGPALFGWLLDMGVGTEMIATGLGAAIIAAALSAGVAIGGHRSSQTEADQV